MILTKRARLIADRLPADWYDGWDHVWLGVSVEDQKNADLRLPELVKVTAPHKFVSAEPLIGQVDLSLYLGPDGSQLPSWVIVGGESGTYSQAIRPMAPEWAQAVRLQAVERGAKFFFKQMGGKTKYNEVWGGDRLLGEQIQEMPDWNFPAESEQLSLF